MDRRRFLIGASITGVTLVSGVVEMPVPLLAAPHAPSTMLDAPLSPLLGRSIAHYVSVTTTTAGRKLSVQILRATREDLIEVGSVSAAEDRVFAAAPLEVSAPLHRTLLSMRLATASNRIAERTARGPGNRVYAHPSILELISPGTTGERIGSWKRFEAVDFYEDSYQFWANPRLPKDRVYVGYFGSDIDAPGGIAYDHNGVLTQLVREDDGATYMQAIAIEPINGMLS